MKDFQPVHQGAAKHLAWLNPDAAFATEAELPFGHPVRYRAQAAARSSIRNKQKHSLNVSMLRSNVKVLVVTIRVRAAPGAKACLDATQLLTTLSVTASSFT